MDKTIREELEKTGLSWEIMQGSKHKKIYLQGRLVGILPRDGKKGAERTVCNTIAQIRRAAQSIFSEGQSCS